MFCNYCGTSNPDNASFCNACGKAIARPPANLAPREEVSPKIAPPTFAALPPSPGIPAVAPAAGNLLTWPFHQKNWIASLWMPLLWWFPLPIFPIGIFASFGWLLDAVRRRAHDAPSLLPQSRDLGRMFLGGLLVVAMYVGYFIVPLLLIALIFSWTWEWHLLMWFIKLIWSIFWHTPHEPFATFLIHEERYFLVSEFAPIIYLVFAAPLFLVGMVRYAVTGTVGSFFKIFSNLALLFRHFGGVLWVLILSSLSYVALGAAVSGLVWTGVGMVPAILLVGVEMWVLAYFARNLAAAMSRDKALANGASFVPPQSGSPPS